MKKVYIVITFLIAASTMFSQSPKREMRSVWLATVWKIDWPSATLQNSNDVAGMASQKKQMITMLDSLKSANMNTVYFQVRSRCDAMYKSSFEPWSTDLVATRGIDPGYDPLQFVIEECHKRGIELHAWLNPYRFESTLNAWSGMQGDYAATNPEWVIRYPNLSTPCSILDPGNPGVTKRITDIVSEIVTNYDVDGIVFDDYFYAYGGTPANYDQYSQNLYKPANMSVNDWRRSNVNGMIASVYNAIQAIKPYVTFGVSPFGIWTTDQSVASKEGIALPSGISGGNMYAEIYCDPVAWLKQGTVDYISPQLYWPTTQTGQQYNVLCPWWSDLSNRFNKHFYSSHSLSAITASNYKSSMKLAPLRLPSGEVLSSENMSMREFEALKQLTLSPRATTTTQEEYGLQIDWNRNSDKNSAPGSVFYSAKQIYTKGFISYLKKNKFQKPALLPAIDWKKTTEQSKVSNIRLEEELLKWDYAQTNLRYSIYAIPKSLSVKTGCFAKSDYLLGISYTNSFDLSKYTYLIASSDFGVAVYDRFGNEFAPSLMGETLTTQESVKLINPFEAAAAMHPLIFTWEAKNDVEYYILEIAYDVLFSNPVCSRILTSNSFSTVNLNSLIQNNRYYWRVKARKIGADDAVSAVRSFVMGRFNILSPVTGSKDLLLSPTIEWSSVGADASYNLELATDDLFSTFSMVYNTTLSSNVYEIPAKLLAPMTNYSVRVKTKYNNIDLITDIIKFTTLAVPVSAAPMITSPENTTTIDLQTVLVTWNGDMPNHRVELSTSNTFPPRQTIVKSLKSYANSVSYANLATGTYYLRVRGESNVGITDWSDVSNFKIDSNVGFENNLADNINYRIIGNHLIVNLPSEKIMSISIHSLSGRFVFNVLNDKKLTEGEHIIELPDFSLSQGLYLVKIQTSGSLKVLKWINK